MDFITGLLLDSHFWVGVAFVVFILMLMRLGVPGMAFNALDGRAAAIQSQLDEANRIRQEAEALLKSIKAQRADTEVMAKDMLANAKSEAKRLESEAAVKLAEQIKRRGELAERKIASAEAAATAEVKAAAAEQAARIAEQILGARIAGATTDPLIDKALGALAERLQ